MADPSSVRCADLAVVRPRQVLVDGQAILVHTTAVAVPQGVKPVLEIVLRDGEGRPVNLADCGFGSLSSHGSESSSEAAYDTTTTGRMVVRWREALSFLPGSVPYEEEGYSWQADAGVVRVAVPEAATAVNALLRGEWGVYDQNDTLVFTYPFYTLVERGQFATDVTEKGLPTVESLRVHLRDRAPEDNYLLAELEWGLGDICESMAYCVRLFNTTPPPMRHVRYNTANFPNPAALIPGVLGSLYRIAARNYRRNRLAYQAAGVTVDDKDRGPEYEKEGQVMLGEYLQWVKTIRASMNKEAWHGGYGSPYGGRWR